MRIGHGYDVHRLVEIRPLILGGITIPYSKGLLGHSDADVLVHAIIDALLGAAGLGDIGQHFPDSDVAYKDISSIQLLKLVVTKLYDNNFSIVNIDCTIIAEEPKLYQFIPKMIDKVSATICCVNVNIKATTEEGLGFTGNKDGIAAHCVALITEINN